MRVLAFIIAGLALALPLQSLAQDAEASYAVPDVSGPLYPLGGGWTAARLRPQAFCGSYTVGDPANVELTVFPPVYRWVKASAADNLEIVQTLVTIPATYKEVTEKIVVAAGQESIAITAPTFNDDGSLRSAAVFEQNITPPQYDMKTRRVIKTPARTVERRGPPEIVDGFKRIIVKPARTVEPLRVEEVKIECGMTQGGFTVHHKDSGQSQTFNDFSKFDAFVKRLGL